MSNVCASCLVPESATAGKWLARARVCDSCVDNGFASSLGLRAPGAPAPFCCNVCCALDAAQFREAVVGDYESRCGPTVVCKDIFLARPWTA